MSFSLTAEYALRAVAELARNPGTLNSADIAARTLVPKAYLVKILQQLQAAGLVESTRGKTGGWCLDASRSREMTVYDVVNAVDAVVRVLECPIHLKEHSVKLCPLHAAMDAAFAKLEDSFRSMRVIDLVDTSVSVDTLVSGLARMHKLQKVRRGRISASTRAKVAGAAKRVSKSKK